MANDIYLAQFIEQLRSELQAAMKKGKDADIRFLAKSVELELEVAAEQKVGAEGELSFKVFGIGVGLGGSGERGSTQTQKLKLILEPVGKDGKTPYISDDGGDLPD